MATWQPTPQPPLRKPPGYRNPNIPTHRLRPPPKPTALPPSFQRNKHRRSHCCRTFCCTLFIVTIILTLIFFTAGTFFYLRFQPRLPEINIKSVNSKKLHVSSSPDGPVLDSQITTRLQIQNPNRNLKMVYGKTRVSLSVVKGGAVLGEAIVPGFTQDNNNVTILEIVTKKHHEILDNKADEELEKGLRSKNLLVNAEIWSGVGIKGSQWSIGSVHVRVVCEGMRLNQVDQNGGTMPKCCIKILDWYCLKYN